MDSPCSRNLKALGKFEKTVQILRNHMPTISTFLHLTTISIFINP